MLTIVYGDEPKCIYNTNVYFKNTYESEWMESSLAKEMIKDMDRTVEFFFLVTVSVRQLIMKIGKDR